MTSHDREFIPFKLDIPFCLQGYRFTPADYAVHERQREFLLSQGFARVACQMGGIIWRLSSEYLPDEVVLEGPSATAVEYGFGCVLKSNEDGGSLWCDDELAPDDLNIICSLHIMLLGMCSEVISISQYIRFT
jgi:hypothetical protein